MAVQSKTLAAAGVFLCMSAAMHVSAILVTGLYISALFLFIIGIFYFSLGRGFLAGADHWAKVVLGIMILGMIGAYVMRLMGLAVPSWWLTMIIWTDLLVALCLLAFVLRR